MRIALAAVMLLLLLPSAGPAVAEQRLEFISTNDKLPPELINSAVIYNGQYYVPYYVFTNYGLGLSYTYYSGSATAYLYTQDRQLFFELTSGRTYDGNDIEYADAAILRSGTVYLPLALMCSYFSHIGYSFITGSEYGDILRITTGAAVLNDADFLQAARTLMHSYYVSFNSQTEPPPATPLPTVAPTPVVTEPPNHEGATLTLSFSGAPAAETLDVLARYKIRTCFFLTAADVEASPDTLRRALGEGHTLGVLSGGTAEDFAAAASRLFEAVRVPTILISPADPAEAENCAALAAAEGLVCAVADYTGGAASAAVWLERDRTGTPALCLAAEGEGLGQILSYITEQKYTVTRPRETDG